MKKTLSIILCLSLIMSTFSFALPAFALGIGNIGIETSEEFGATAEELENSQNAVLAADTTVFNHTFEDSEDIIYTTGINDKGVADVVITREENDGNHYLKLVQSAFNKDIKYVDDDGMPAGSYTFSCDVYVSKKTNKGTTPSTWSFVIGGVTSKTFDGIAPETWTPLSWDFVQSADKKPYELLLHTKNSGLAYAEYTYIDNVKLVRHPESCTIKYDLNGGTSETALDDVSAITGDEYNLPEGLNRDHFFFRGWATQVDATSGVYEYTPDRKDFGTGTTVVTLYAVWVAKTYDVVFDGNGAQTTSFEPKYTFKEIDGTQNVILPERALLSKNGYLLTGWTDGTNDFTSGQTVNVNGPVTFTAVWKALSDFQYVQPSATKPEYNATNVDLRYPVAYYTFDKEVNADDVTLENVNNPSVGGIWYDVDTKTVMVFPKANLAGFGKTISFAKWDSYIPTADGSSLLSFPAAKFTLASTMSDDGENLTPFADMEHGWSPIYASSPAEVKLVDDGTGNHAAYVDYNSTSAAQVWLYSFHNFVFKPQTTYKIICDVKFGGFSDETITSGSQDVIINTQYTSGDTVDNPDGHSHLSGRATIGTTDTGWKTITKEQEIRNVINMNNMTMSLYANPPAKGATEYYIDNLKIYEKVGTSFDAGPVCTLTGTQPEVLYGYNGDKVTLPSEMPYTASDTRWTITGWTDGKEDYALGEEITVKGAKTIVPKLKTDYETHTVTFTSDYACTTPNKMQVIVGDTVDFGAKALQPGDVPAYNFIGWSTDGTKEHIVTSVQVNDDMTLKAVFEIITEFIYDNEETAGKVSIKNGTSYYDDDEKEVVVVPNNSTADAYLQTQVISLNTVDCDYIDVTFDSARAGVDNKFNESFGDCFVYFAYPDNDRSWTGDKGVVGKFDHYTDDTHKRAVFRFDMAANAKWTGTIARLRIDPYNGTPEWGVSSIVFVKKTPIASVVVSGITAPELRMAPDTTASVPNGVDYKLDGISWKPDCSGSFFGDTAYTVVATLSPNKGYTFNNGTTATIDGIDAVTSYDASTGKLSVEYTYPKTAPFAPITVAISGGNSINVADGSLNLTAKVTTVNSGDKIDTKDVVWSVDNTEICSISDDGVLTAFYDGTVNVTATSVYNPAVSDTVAVVITNQIANYTITFNKGTNSEKVHDDSMPGEMYGKRYITFPDKKPIRDGFVFAGWSDKANSTEIVTKPFINADTTFYAVWYSGISWEFNTDGDRQGFTPAGCTASVSGGVMNITTTSTDPMVYVGGLSLDTSKYGAIEVTLTSSKNSNLQIFFQSRAPGASSSTGLSEANSKTLPFPTATDGAYTTLKFDMTTLAGWKDTITNLRFDTGNTSGLNIKIDSIRIVNYANESFDISELAAPVAKAAATTTATSVDADRYSVKSVTWSPALLYDYYFDGDTVYTANVTVETNVGWILSDNPIHASIDGMPAEYVLNGDGTATLSASFPVTNHIDNKDAFEIDLNSYNDETMVVTTRKIFSGDTLDLADLKPDNVPSGYRWIGWTKETVAPGEKPVEMIDSIVSTGYTKLFAVYEKRDNFDFSNDKHRDGVVLANDKDSSLTYENNFAVVTPASASKGSYLNITNLGLKAANYGLLEVIYDGTRAGVYNNVEYINKFNTAFKPAVYFSLNGSSTNFTKNNGLLVKTEKVTVDGVMCYKYTYDMTSNANWTGYISAISLRPYDNFPAWGVRSVKLIPNVESDETVKITGLDVPKTWMTPDDTVDIDANHVFIEGGWSGELNEMGAYKPSESYSYSCYVRPKTGIKFAPDTKATINGKEATVDIDDDGRMHILYNFADTEPLKDIGIRINGSKSIIKDGRYEEYTGTAYAKDGSSIPMTDVTWSIRNSSDTTETSPLAVIKDDGRVVPLLNGTVIITATSVYDPTVSADYSVTITGQSEKYRVSFNKNTTDTVTGMPEEQYVKGEFTPNANPVRSGYSFEGWAKTDDTATAMKKINITGETTLYAIWSKCVIIDFNVASEKPSSASQIKDGFVNTAEGCYEFTVSGSDPIINFLPNISGDDFKKVQIRFATDAAGSNLTAYFTSKDSSGNYIGYPWDGVPAHNSQFASNNRTASYSCGSLDNFVTVTHDFSSKADWRGTISSLRLDMLEGNIGAKVKIDYIKFITEKRDVTFDANGGKITVKSQQYDSYTDSFNMGSIKLSYVPQRDGYKFMGWSKTPDSMENLYKTSMTLIDDTKLYAMWNMTADLINLSDDELSDAISLNTADALEAMTVSSDNNGILIKSPNVDVRPVIKIADSVTVDSNTSTVLIKAKYAYKKMTANNNMLLNYTDEQGVERTEIVASKLSSSTSGYEYFVCDMSGVESFKGNITNVSLTLPEGKITLFSLSEVTFTDNDTAKQTIEDVKSVDDTQVSDSTESTNRIQYPNYVHKEDTSTNTPSSDPFVAATSSKEAITFHFDSDADMKLIGSYRQMSKVSMSNSILTLQSSGFAEGKSDSPAFFTPGTMKLDAATHKYVIIRAKSEITPSAAIRVYFRTADAGYAEAKSIAKDFTEKYQTVAYDMSTLSGWTGTITGLFFSMAGNAKGLLDIDYISFANEIPNDPEPEEDFPYIYTFSSSTFSDVKSSDWFYGDVEKAYKMGFMNGVSETTFDPNGTVTIAQAVTIAARINAIYNKKTIDAAKDGEEWYTPYVTYATKNGIIKKTTFADYTVVATRSEVARIFYASMPEEWFKAINVFKSVPDVDKADAGKRAILGLYNSGVVIGVDDAHNYLPTQPIKRSEISAIINRVAIPSSRKRIVTQDEIDSLKLRYEGSDLAGMVLGNCTNPKVEIKDGMATATGKANDAGRADPIAYLTNHLGKIDGSMYKTIKIGLKWNTSDVAQPSPQIYFTTPSGSWSAERMLKSTWDGKFDENGVATFVFDCKTNAQWTGDITAIRFDPFDAAFWFAIAWVEVIPQ